ncbi:MAG: hypothetical protein WCT52_05510 [Candidatus Micrarchaeia archaeon]
MIIQTKGKLNALGFNSPRMIEELRKTGIKVKTDKPDGDITRIGGSIFLRNALLEKAVNVKERIDVRTAVDNTAKDIAFMADTKKSMEGMKNESVGYQSYHATVASMNLDGIEKSAKSGGYIGLIEKELTDLKQLVNGIIEKVGTYEGL